MCAYPKLRIQPFDKYPDKHETAELERTREWLSMGPKADDGSNSCDTDKDHVPIYADHSGHGGMEEERDPALASCYSQVWSTAMKSPRMIAMTLLTKESSVDPAATFLSDMSVTSCEGMNSLGSGKSRYDPPDAPLSNAATRSARHYIRPFGSPPSLSFL